MLKNRQREYPVGDARETVPEIARVSAVAAVAVGIVLSLFVWPGFLAPTTCQAWAAAHESVNGRTYCDLTLALPVIPTNWTRVPCNVTYAIHSLNRTTALWGYSFEVTDWFTCGRESWSGASTSLNISSPNGSFRQFEVYPVWAGPWYSYPPREGLPPGRLVYLAPTSPIGAIFVNATWTLVGLVAVGY
jgi:hypothetical protein